MFIPYSTDAPIYHYPITTISLIVVNVIFFFAFCLNSGQEEIVIIAPDGKHISAAEFESEIQQREAQGKEVEQFVRSHKVEIVGDPHRFLILEFGRGFRPWQWVTSAFMHQDIAHLLGNMIFLWSFGLVVEGKLGNFLFGGVYLFIEAVQSFIVQMLMWNSVGGALGASGAIFGLMALIVIFAPVNSFDVIFIFGFRVITLEIQHLIFAAFYLVFNLFFFFLGGATMSSEALHLAGFLVGLPVGLFLLMRGYVDCEGYDLISWYQNNLGKKSTVGKRQRRARAKARQAMEEAANPPPTLEQTRELIQKQISVALAEKNFIVAMALQQKLESTVPGTSWDPTQLAGVIRGLLENKDYQHAQQMIEKHIELFEHRRFDMQVYLLKLWLQAQQPRRALKYMKQMASSYLTQSEQEKLRKLAAIAKQQIQEGVLELE
ncbi:MAG: rhomboid family intramembrane serine protease [Planctomycetales bacterium]|nr:rhomboid family intramembrane serine protease [Planctomycetales bacterium]